MITWTRFLALLVLVLKLSAIYAEEDENYDDSFADDQDSGDSGDVEGDGEEFSGPLFSEDSAVVTLDPTNFQQKIYDSHELWVVTFCAPFIGLCQQMAPELEAAADAVTPYGIHVAYVNADEHPGIAARLGIQGYPIIKVFRDPPKPNPYTRHNSRAFYDYNGPRTAKSIKKFCFAAMPNFVRFVEDATWYGVRDEAYAKKDAIVLLISNKEKVSPLYRSVASDFNGRGLTFTQTTEGHENTCREAYDGADKDDIEVPSIVLLRKGEAPVKFSGNLREKADIAEFLERYAGPEPEPAVPSTGPVALTTKTFQRSVQMRVEGWMIQYLQDGEEQHPDFFDAAVALEDVGMLRAGTVDCVAHSVLCKGIEGPFGIYPYGDQKRAFFVDTLEKAQRRVVETLPNKIAHHPPEGMDQLLVTGQMENKMSLIWITDDPHEPPALKGLALAFEESVQVAVIANPSNYLKERFGISQVPLLIAMFGKLVQGDAAETGETQFHVMNYDENAMGPINFPNVAGYLYSVLQQINPQALRSAEGANTVADTGVVVELSEQNFESLCGSTGKLCAVALLNGAESEESVQAYVDILQSVSDREGSSRASPFTFTWVDALCQPEFASAFDITSEKLPSMVVFSPKKGRFAPFVGVYEEGNIRDFLRGIVSGRITTSPVYYDPVLRTHDCAELHRDFAPPAEVEASEEDDDLMAELMAELQAEAEAEARAKRAAAAEERKAKKSKKSKKDKKKKKKKSKKKKKDE